MYRFVQFTAVLCCPFQLLTVCIGFVWVCVVCVIAGDVDAECLLSLNIRVLWIIHWIGVAFIGIYVCCMLLLFSIQFSIVVFCFYFFFFISILLIVLLYFTSLFSEKFLSDEIELTGENKKHKLKWEESKRKRLLELILASEYFTLFFSHLAFYEFNLNQLMSVVSLLCCVHALSRILSCPFYSPSTSIDHNHFTSCRYKLQIV